MAASSFSGLRFDPDPGPYAVKLRRSEWRLTRPYRLVWDGGEVVVPEGFVTDGPSVPDWLQSFVSPNSDLFQPSVGHDFLYVREPGGWTRYDADCLLIAGMDALGMGWLDRQKVWLAVRAGGAGLWGDGARERKERKLARLDGEGLGPRRLRMKQAGWASA